MEEGRQNGCWTYSTLSIKVLYVPKNFYTSPKQISGYAPGYRMSPAVWDHSVTFYSTKVDAPHPNPSQQAGTRFTYPGGIEGWVDLGYLATEWPGVELAPSQSQVQLPNHYTTEPPKLEAVVAVQ